MPQKASHLKKAQHNAGFATRIQQWSGSPDYHDWDVVAVFYTALHLIDAALADHGLHPTSHFARGKEVKKHLSQIHPQYLALYNLSREARYKPQRMITSADAAKARNQWYASIIGALTP